MGVNGPGLFRMYRSATSFWWTLHIVITGLLFPLAPVSTNQDTVVCKFEILSFIQLQCFKLDVKHFTHNKA